MKNLVILDRDGVINVGSDGYIKSPAEWQAIPGSLEAIALLNQKGFTVVVATNQAGISKGLFNLTALDAVHNKLLTQVKQQGGKISQIFYCPHKPDDECACRKPKPGLVLAIFEHFDIVAGKDRVFFVGDSTRDLQAALKTACIPVLVKTGHGLKTLAEIAKLIAARDAEYNYSTLQVYEDLLDFAQQL